MAEMKIYLAGSWRNEVMIRSIALWLREDGHEVDCFCDPSCKRFVFHWNELAQGDLQEYDAISFLDDPRVQKAFKEDKKWLDWAEVVIMVFPCGRSAHLEGGYAKGRGKKLILIGEFSKGEFDVMYGFADVVFRYGYEQLKEMRAKLKKGMNHARKNNRGNQHGGEGGALGS